MAALAVVVAGRTPVEVVRALFARNAAELWALKTPYYEVDISLIVLHAPETLAADALPPHHAVLVVYDPGDSTGWRLALQVMESLKDCTEDRPALLLAEEGKEGSTWTVAEQEVQRHAIDCGFELVVERAQPQGYNTDEESKKRGLFADVEGRARVHEALTAHRWPGLRPLASNRGRSASSLANAAPATHSPSSVPGPASPTAMSSSSSAAPAAAQPDVVPVSPGAMLAHVRERLDRAAASDLGEGKEEEEEDLGALLKEMLALRAHAAQLPDSERRALAASVALYFAEKLGPDQ